MAKKKKPIAAYSRMFESFAGSYVTIAVRSLRANPKAANNVIANLMLAGFLLDECEEYFYLGENAKEIFAAVKKSEVMSIMMGGEAADPQINIPEGTEIQ